MASAFHTTRWSIVLAAGNHDDTGSNEALAQLCAAYWTPLYSFARRSGHGIEASRDLTQEYFVKLLEKDYLGDVVPERGKFRSFLLASMRHFLINEWNATQALKRGGGKLPISLDLDQAEAGFVAEPADDETPESLFEKQWAHVVLQRTTTALGREQKTAGNETQFVRLQPHLVTGDAAHSYHEIAQELDMTEAAVKMSVHRLRRRFGELLRDEIAHTVTDTEQVDAEIRHLFEVLRR